MGWVVSRVSVGRMVCWFGRGKILGIGTGKQTSRNNELRCCGGGGERKKEAEIDGGDDSLRGRIGRERSADDTAPDTPEFLLTAVHYLTDPLLRLQLSYRQAGPGRKARQGQEEISRNHVPTFFLGSVDSKLGEKLLPKITVVARGRKEERRGRKRPPPRERPIMAGS